MTFYDLNKIICNLADYYHESTNCFNFISFFTFFKGSKITMEQVKLDKILWSL